MRLRAAVQFSHHARSGNAKDSADFLSRIDLNPKERVEVKTRNDITIRPIQVNL